MTIDYSTSPLLLSILLPKFIDFSMFLRLFNTKKTPRRLIKFSLRAFNYRRYQFSNGNFEGFPLIQPNGCKIERIIAKLKFSKAIILFVYF